MVACDQHIRSVILSDPLTLRRKSVLKDLHVKNVARASNISCQYSLDNKILYFTSKTYSAHLMHNKAKPWIGNGLNGKYSTKSKKKQDQKVGAYLSSC